MKLNLGYVFLLFIIISCNDSTGQKTESTPDSESNAISFATKSIKKESPTCATDTMKCASVSIQYLVAENAPEAVLKNINDTLNYYYVNSVIGFEDDNLPANTDIEKVGDNFIKDYEVFLVESGKDDFITPWTIEVNSEVEYLSDKTACIMYGTYAYTGGAHPNYFLKLLNFDITTGKKLGEEDIIKDKAALEKIAEQAFRKEREIAPNESLDEAGYFWGEAFGLPENIGLVKEGLKLYYNPYEVAAYVMGPTEFVIPYAQLEGLLKI